MKATQLTGKRQLSTLKADSKTIEFFDGMF